MTKSLTTRALQRVARDTFLFWERHGIHVTPVHFTQPIPDTRSISDELWDAPSKLIGIDMCDAGQLALLDEIEQSFRKEYVAFPIQPTEDPTDYYLENRSYRSIDAEILYSMVRRLKPKRILEIGSGYTSLLMAKALDMNAIETANEPTDYTICDPYMNEMLKEALPSVSRLILAPVQGVELAEFERLGEDDILFIDSSHVLHIGSDVHYLFLEVLPRLAPGVMVHIHDIFMPAEYPREWVVASRRFWNEQYLLQAFLAFNDHWSVMWAGSHMQLNHPSEVQAAFPSSSHETVPGSFWIRRNVESEKRRCS